MLELLFLLLPVAAGYGYIMGRNSVRQAQRKQSSILSKHYFRGLNFLLSDQPDRAVDTLIKMINVNSDTVETHIAMGNFFRHRGEIDRAIRVHQNLVSRDEIQATQRELALKELGRDYMQAGFLERAEGAFVKLLSTDKHFEFAQQQLFAIYQTTKEWPRAIELAEKMVSENDDIRGRLAHFYCEQAQSELDNEQIPQALALLQKAVNVDEKAIRPWLMLGEVTFDQGRLKEAGEYLTQIASRDKNWFIEAIPLLKQIAAETADWQHFEALLKENWVQSATLYLAMADVLVNKGQPQQAADYLFEQIQKTPTMRGFHRLMQLYCELSDDPNAKATYQQLNELVASQIAQRPRYRCKSCGFSGRKLYWLCPSCKKWGVVHPIRGLDGE
ncbi:lipopolysaccharide assembly protein LapB [Alteromonas gilva]|uniref:Lipopolysaccharide assembly protein B n=1 Tax=Alteromonas gilva TaxID=2987522 RepID=A0ABT5L285_9ALTE|nr:lipopolysaccharide assembly protein LapB [Alteromonas gilva]MDC8831145.1 lipopolysaccharide assembly protein LapB [Alteromonas gilva]